MKKAQFGDSLPAVGAERRRRIEFGDFQTPAELADAACTAIGPQRPATIIEPTCGTGTFLAAALRRFPGVRHAIGMDVNRRYVQEARRRLADLSADVCCRLETADFFRTDWVDVISKCAEPILVVGNPPWVTSAALGILRGANHPPKENGQGLAGIDALTGKSNFDVSEWMIVHLLQALRDRRATLAMLCKAAVAQKALGQAWNADLPIEQSEIHPIDARLHFGVHVDACLFICRLGTRRGAPDCRVVSGHQSGRPSRTFGLRDGHLVADVAVYERVRHLVGGAFRWRSGVKHDCAAVFELREEDSKYRNGFGERVDVERELVFPLLKSSQVASGDVRSPRRHLLLPQRRIGEETRLLARRAPKTWRYLRRHAERLDRRASSIYRGQPPFSVFGVGSYTFSRWKVVVSGFYAARRFTAVGPMGSVPVVCDDTCYFLPCRSAAEARSRADTLNSDRGQEFFSAFVFEDGKRPLTSSILRLLDLDALAADLRATGSGDRSFAGRSE